MKHKKGLSNCFNYTGSKYRYLDDLFAILPTSDNLTVCDPFVGGGDLCAHLNKTWSILASDSMAQVIEMHQFIQKGVISSIQVMAKAYENKVNNLNKKAFLAFREKYNDSPNPLDLYILLCHSNSNRIRFSTKGFNVSFGDRWFNSKMQRKLNDYQFRLMKRRGNIEFISHEFTECDFSRFDITLIDPPYLNSVATYNESGGWLESDEIALHDKIKSECNKFVYFGQIWANGKHNELLDNFSKNYNVKILKDTTKHCSANRKGNKTVEVMIWNF